MEVIHFCVLGESEKGSLPQNVEGIIWMCKIVIIVVWPMMRYIQVHVYILSPLSLKICKYIPCIGVDSLLTSFSSHDPGD